MLSTVPDSSAESENESENTPDTVLSPTPSVIPQDSEEENKAEDGLEVVQTSFRVKYGTDVSDICKQLEEAGIIKSASEFKQYLVDHEFDNTIRAGLYKVSSDMTYEELANVLRRQKNN